MGCSSCGGSTKTSKYGIVQPKSQLKSAPMPSAQEIMNQTAISNAIKQNGAQSRYYTILNQKSQVYR